MSSARIWTTSFLLWSVVIVKNVVIECYVLRSLFRNFIKHFKEEKSMMTSSNGNIFSITGPLWGYPPVTGRFLWQRPVTGSFDIFFICAWTNGLANNWDAGDLRRNRAHYDVTVMCMNKNTLIWHKINFQVAKTYMKNLCRIVSSMRIGSG